MSGVTAKKVSPTPAATAPEIIETLRKFCSPDREGLTELFKVKSFMAACDGRILVWARASEGFQGGKTPQGTRWIIDMHRQARRWKALGELPPAPKTGELETIAILGKPMNGAYVRKVAAEFREVKIALTCEPDVFQCPLALRFRFANGEKGFGLLMGLRTGGAAK